MPEWCAQFREIKVVSSLGTVGRAFCAAIYVHVPGYHSIWVTDAWRVLQAIWHCRREKFRLVYIMTLAYFSVH